MKIELLQQQFRERFHAEPRIFRAPGRINLIGEHTDYNDGFVLPLAIDLATYAAVSTREDRQIRVDSLNLADSFTFDLDDPHPAPQKSWTDYVQGVAVVAEQAGLRLCGANLLIESDVPPGAGLSSSAALEVSVAQALFACAELSLARMQVARLCQQAESEFVGMRCGIMDQFISCFGKNDHALLLDCRTLAYQALPLPANVRLVIANTMIRHELADGAYNERRADCEEGARRLGVSSLRDLTTAQFAARKDSLSDRLMRRCRHVITENERVQAAAEALQNGDLTTLGKLLDASHQSLRDDYEVSCAELDLMVELAHRQPGVYGARMTGGGFGGSVIALVAPDATDDFIRNVALEYQRLTRLAPVVSVCRAAQGAEEIKRKEKG